MEHTTLDQYVEARVRAGDSRESIRERLLAVGWAEEEADRAYASALIVSGVPVPVEGARGRYAQRASTLDVMLNFFSFILLGIVVSALGTLYFEVIGKYFPDALARVRNYYSPADINTEAVYYAMAALIVAYPLYYVVVRIWFKRFREDEAKMESKLTKWLTYLVLLAASVTIVGDLIAILFTFFRGEITVRFFLKALTIFVIAGMVSGFYFLERKKVQYRQDIPRRTFQLFGYVLTGIVLVGILLGFFAAGSPSLERMRTFDEQRASDLQNLTRCVSDYTQQFSRLPDTLDDLETSTIFSYCSVNDPETGEKYAYRVTTPLHLSDTSLLEGEVELCANFALATTGDTGYSYPINDKWLLHDAGRSCDREAVTVQVPLRGLIKN